MPANNNKYIQTIKTKDLVVNNLHKDSLFFPYEALAYKKGKQYSFSIEQKDILSRPDCKIGDFANNIWFRPAAATNTDFKGYKTVSSFSTVVQNCMTSHGFSFVGWIERDDLRR